VTEAGTSKLGGIQGCTKASRLRCIWGVCLGPCLRRRRRKQ